MKIPKIVFLFGLTSFLTDMSSEIIMPILPMFIASLGGTMTIIGLIGGLTDGLASIMKFLSGFWSDKIHKRKPFVISGYVLSAISKALFVFVNSWIYVLILKVIERTGKGLRDSPRDALISLSVKKQQGKVFGFHQFMDTFGAILGTIIAIIIVSFFSLNYKLIFIISALIAFTGIIPLLFIKEESDGLKKYNFSFKFLDSSLKKFLFVVAIFSLANFTYMIFIMKATSVLGMKENLVFILFLYLIFNISSASFTYYAGRLYDKIKENALIIGMGFFAITMIGFLFLQTKTTLIILFILYGLSMAFTKGNFRAMASQLSKKETKGTVLGSYYAISGLFALPSGAIAGFLWDKISINAPFIFSLVLTLIAMFLFYLFNFKEK